MLSCVSVYLSETSRGFGVSPRLLYDLYVCLFRAGTSNAFSQSAFTDDTLITLCFDFSQLHRFFDA